MSKQVIAPVVNPVAAAVNKGIEGTKATIEGITSGSLSQTVEGAKGVTAGGVDYVKAVVGVTADNKSSFAKSGEAILADPAGAVSGAAQAYATGGASLVATAGQSLLSGIQGASPQQLAAGSKGGSAPVLPGENNAIYRNEPADFTKPVLIVGAGILAYSLIRRR